MTTLTAPIDTTPAEFLACAEKYAHLPTIAAIMRAYAENPQYTGLEAFYRAGQIKHGDGAERAISGASQPASNKRGTGKPRRQPTIPDGNPDFWRDLRDFNVAHEKPVEEQGKHSHYRRSVNWLMHPGNCDGDCGPRKIRWMCAQPEESHAGRNGRRLAKVYGVYPHAREEQEAGE